MSSEVRLPVSFSQVDASQSCPPDWAPVRVEDAISVIKQGPRWEKKSVQESGSVKVLDQSKDGVIGFHDSEPGVFASPEDPVVTFANHTCNIRILKENFSTIQNVFAFRGRDQVSETRFLQYWLRGRVATEEYKGFFPTLRSQWLPLPPLDEQRRIAGVLGALDDLIEVNRGLIEDLDSALLASWDSVAGESVDLIAVGDKVEIRKGLSYKGAFLREEGLPMINMGSFGVDGKYRKSGLKWYDESQVKERNLLVKDDLVVVNTDLTQSCDILARPILVPFERATSTHHTFQVRVPGDSSEKFWIYCALRHERVRKSLASHATGTTVAALPAQTLLCQEIPWADSDTILSWWKTTEPLYRASLELSEENEELIQTRDELLPLLLSGRVRVGDVAA